MAKTLPTLSFDKELTDKQKSALAEADKQVKAEKLIGSTAPRQARTNNEAEKASERAAIERAKAKQLAKNAGQAFTNRQQNAARQILQNAGQKLADNRTAEEQASPLVNQGKKAVERVTGRAGQKLTDEQIALGLVTKDPALSLNSGAGIMARQAERKVRFEQAAKSAELESERQKQVIEAQRQANEEYKRRFVEPIETAKKDADDAAKSYQDALNMWVAASRGGSSKDEVDELWKQAESWKYYAMTKAQEYTRIHKQAQEEAEAWEEARAEAARQAAARRAKLEYDLEQARMRQAETGRQLAPMLVREAGERLRQTGPETYGFGDYAEMPAARRTADIIRAAAYGNLAGYANAVGMLDPYAEAVSQDEGSILAGNYRVPQMRTAGQAHMQSLARQWDELGRTSLERAKADLSTGGQVAVEIGVAALQMLGDIAISQGRGTLYTMTVRAGGGYAMEAARDGAGQDEQFVYGLAGGAVEAATEKIFAVAPLFNKVFGKPIIKADFVDSAIKSLARTAKSPTGKAIVDRAAHGLLAMTSEGAEEVLADFMEPVIRKATYDRDGRIEIDWEQMLHDGIIGAALGGLGVPGIIARSGQVRSGYELDKALDKYQAAIIEHGILSDEARQASMNVWRMTGKLSTQDVAKAVSERLAVDPEAAAKEPGVRYWLAKGRETERAPAAAEEAEPVIPEAETQRIEDEEAAPEAVAPNEGLRSEYADRIPTEAQEREEIPPPVLPGMEELRTQEAERAPQEPERPAPSVGEADSSPFAQGEPYAGAEREDIPAPVLPGMDELRTQGAAPTPPATEAESGTAAPMGAQAERPDEVPAPVLPGTETPESAGQAAGPAQSESGAGTVRAGDRLTMYDGNAYTVTEVSPTGISIRNENGEASALTWDMLEGLQRAGAVTIERSGENGTLPDRGRYGESGGRAGGQAEGLRPGGEYGQTAAERVRAADRGRALSTDNGQRAPLVSGREIGLRNGSDTKAARVIPEHRWRDSGHSALFEEIRAAGYEPIPFTGTVYVETAGRRAAVDGFRFERNGRRYMGVKMDSARLSPRQIARHELAHEEYVRQPLMVRAVWDRLTANGDESFYNLLEDYVQGLNSMYGEELERYMEEIFCDAQAGISRRYAPMDERLRGRISETAGQVRQEYADATESRGPPREGGERYSASEDDEASTPKAEGHEAMEQLARERDGDIARAADEKRAAAAARVSDQTLKNNIREKRRQIQDIEDLIGDGEANPGQARKLETMRKELAAYEAELKKRTAAKPKKAKSQAKAEKPEAKPAPYADPIEDDGKGKGSAQEAVKAAEAAEKAEREKGKKKTAKPHRAAAETAKKLVGLFGVEKEDRARAEQLVMDALVKYARRGRMSTGEVRELVDGLFALGTVEGEARNVEAEDFRKQMRRRRIYVSDELKSEFGEDYESLRKRAFSAGIYFVNDSAGMAPDMVNSELAEAYPGFFDAGEADMGAVLEKIVSIAEEGQAERLSMEDFLQTLAETNTDYARDYVRETEEKVRKYLLEFAKNFKLEAAMDKYWQGQLWEQEKRHQRDLKARERSEEGRARELAREQIIKDRTKRAEQRHAAAQWRQEQRERKAVFEAVRRAARLSRKVNLGTLSEMEDALREVNLDRLQAIKPTDRSAEEKAKLEIASARAALAEAIGGIDILSRRLSNQGIENRETLAEDYRKLKEELGDNFIPLKGIEERIGQLSKKQIDEMSIDDVRELAKTISSMVAEIENGQKLLSDMREQSLHDAAAAARRDIEGTKGFRAKRKHKEVNPVTKLLAEGQLSPGRVMSMIGGWRDAGVWEDFRRIFEEATDREMRFRDEADRLYAFFSDESHEDYKERRKWLESSYGRKAKWEKLRVEIYDPEAVVENMERKQLPTTFEDIEITPMMKVALYLHAQNDDNLNHIAVGGIVIPYKKLMQDGKVKAAYEEGNSQRLRITPAAMKAIARDVKKDKYAYEFAKLMHKYTDEVSKDAINGVSLTVEGFERAAVKNYWPIESAEDFVGGGPGSWGDYASVESIGSIANERVPRAGNPIMLFDAVETFKRQKDTVAKYAAYTIPLRDWDALMAYNFHRKGGVAFESNMRKVIESKWGAGVNKYFDQLEKDLSFKTAPDKIEFMSKLRGNFASAWLSFNASVALSQAAAYPTALPYIGLDGMASGLKLWNKVDSELIGKYTGVLAYREGTGFSPEAMDFLKTNNAFARLMKKHPQLNWPEQMDTFWIKRLWAACEYRVAKDTDLRPGENPKSGEDPYYRVVADLFRKAVFDTQYNSSTFQRPGLLRRDNEIIKLVTMFKTDAMQHYNMIFEAAGRLGRAQEDYKAAAEEDKDEARKRVKQARENLASNIAAVIGSEVLWSSIKGGFKVLRGSAGAFATGAGAVTVASFAKGVAALTADSLAGSVLFGEEILQFAAALVDALSPDDDDEDKVKTQYYGIELNVIGEIADFSQDVVYLAQSIGQKDHSWRKRTKDIAISLLEAAGVPAGGVTRDFEGILRKAFPEGKYALDNFWKELKKADLAKIPDTERAAAISVLIGNRVEISDEVAEELARLYGAEHKKAVPAALPTKYTVDGEEKTLNTTQLDAYKDAWGGAVAGQLEKLIKSPAYVAADDTGREKMINMLYDYAGGLAKEAAVDVAPADWVSQSRELIDSGKMSLTDIIAYRSAGGRLDSAIKYIDEGMSAEGAITAAGVLSELEPEDGKSQVSNGQKLMALGTELSDQKDKNAAAHKILSSESAVAKYDEAIKGGLTTYEYGACLSAIGGVKPHEGRQDANQWQKVMALDDALKEQKDVQTAAKILILDGSTAEEYDAAIKAGFSSYEYAEMQDGFTTVEPHEGRKEASYDQKLDVIVKTISPHRQVEAAKAITESEDGKANLDKVIDAGISLSTYADYQEALNITYAHDDVDENGEKVKDSRKKHMFEYVSGLPLTAQQKSVLIGTKYAESTVEKERLW